MKTFLASALLVLAASAAEQPATATAAVTTVDATKGDAHVEAEKKSVTVELPKKKKEEVVVEPEVVIVEPEVIVDPVIHVDPIVDPAPVEDALLMDYVDQEGHAIKDVMHVSKEVKEETAEALLKKDLSKPVYHDGELVSVHGDECEKAIGHDGHYDEETGVWMLEEDWDYEPEWRCLMRPLLRDATTDVQAAELSVESRSILQEKKALVEVHERLVKEAKEEHEKASCLEHIERKMAKYQECELEVLRTYVQVADAYPTTWVQFLEQKKVCVDTFAAEVAECSRLFIWDQQYYAEHLELIGIDRETREYLTPAL